MNAIVVAFPLSRQQKLVSGIAHVLQSKSGEEANRFWHDTAKALLQQQMRIGVATKAAEAEVRNLLYAVLAEIEAGAAIAR